MNGQGKDENEDYEELRDQETGEELIRKIDWWRDICLGKFFQPVRVRSKGSSTDCWLASTIMVSFEVQ